MPSEQQEPPTTDAIRIDVALVRRLVAAQFPQWAALPIAPAEPQGWDNRTFRLGPELTVRLPSAERYTPQVTKEQRWLPALAPHLPQPIPAPLALGRPGAGYPWPWSVYRWLDGETARRERIADLPALAADLAAFLVALQRIDASGGPPPGPHSFFRGGPLATYDGETRRALATLHGLVDARAAMAVWEAALAAPWYGPPVWFHGDVAVNNLLVRSGRLCAVLDFGCCGVDDPACDTVIAWTFLDSESRAVFRAGLPIDDDTWVRGRGWALWKALITLAEDQSHDSEKAVGSLRTICALLADAGFNRGGGES